MVGFAANFVSAADEPPNHRTPANDAELRYWLGNMIRHHRFSDREVRDATGLSIEAIRAACERFDIRRDNRPRRDADAPLLVLPYPGGRHPRIGFLDGAVRPQRETKVSIFTPWDEHSYVVADVPEAIWSNLGLTYLAHTHVETIWTKQGVELDKLEWNRNKDGTFDITRRLPNGITFTSKVAPKRGHVLFHMSLTNGTNEKLTGLRVQNCVMLKGAPGFAQQDNENKIIRSPFIAASNDAGGRWIITAWTPVHRPWANAKCPCIHSDPQFPDCEPGKTVHIRGWLSFYEGTDVKGEFDRIEASQVWKR